MVPMRPNRVAMLASDHSQAMRFDTGGVCSRIASSTALATSISPRLARLSPARITFANGAFGARKSGDFHDETRKFFVNYFKQIALVFGGAWNGRKYSIKSASALRAFIRVAPDVVRRLDQEHADRGDFRAIGRVIAPWGRRIGDLRFETEGAWKRGGTTVDSLTKELKLALQYPEGAAV